MIIYWWKKLVAQDSTYEFNVNSASVIMPTIKYLSLFREEAEEECFSEIHLPNCMV
jgi:hypothetical protein